MNPSDLLSAPSLSGDRGGVDRAPESVGTSSAAPARIADRFLAPAVSTPAAPQSGSNPSASACTAKEEGPARNDGTSTNHA